MKQKNCDELRDEIPHFSTIDVGYFEGRQSLKVWIVSEKDLDAMYQKSKAGSEILLWIENIDEYEDSDQEPEKKKRRGVGSSKRSEESDAVYIKNSLLSMMVCILFHNCDCGLE